MGFDLEALREAVETHGRVVRVVIAGIKGSSPREVGAAMLVWKDSQSGTIGGGTLEYQAAKAARAQTQASLLTHHALGPEMGQCCGGAVSLLSEVYDRAALETLDETLIARATSGEEMPLSVKRLLATARGQGITPEPQMVDGWMIEPVHKPNRNLWIWGAGHVGRALVDVLSPLPDLAITWIDTGLDRFPDTIAAGVTTVPVTKPAELVRHAPTDAEHLVLTYSHNLDLELCNRLLLHDFGFAGLIGSATKWARFRSRLAALGHSPERISRITCPIGDPNLGKHPQMIAVGVAAQLLRPARQNELKKDLSA
ncbi:MULTISPECIES: xanthine dehydrogenase accessory protein XdhC [unclassified Ruegeria]|uniref:xanthine dehydrogenase accessory protein XdhC n=1 Tax=unclassified Ruegeria TaxID=2625375 RepID=UPI001489943D|nr:MULTISPECIES: xanthine dehydrogenase accessory protein XdhC [unclassified Ruegeria]NOD76681.1 xanthine dehydrogenase accessory protein XdhC [Ruegeria sp. HKCCD4332]NOD89401.1 xanthine dehydrogenase accessory protein XdhC [Ruegeria sp. HKCCD4318]NOE13436.1 xanthine dehydrogenase accessory protein XdhC [Ruegeria sp. HKCCD4318-2]NOG07815.1 xanthine dehydrogenase accessory protein XdhC [Ruegeria sp. HKCCD4315]